MPELIRKSRTPETPEFSIQDDTKSLASSPMPVLELANVIMDWLRKNTRINRDFPIDSGTFF